MGLAYLCTKTVAACMKVSGKTTNGMEEAMSCSRQATLTRVSTRTAKHMVKAFTNGQMAKYMTASGTVESNRATVSGRAFRVSHISASGSTIRLRGTESISGATVTAMRANGRAILDTAAVPTSLQTAIGTSASTSLASQRAQDSIDGQMGLSTRDSLRMGSSTVMESGESSSQAGLVTPRTWEARLIAGSASTKRTHMKENTSWTRSMAMVSSNGRQATSTVATTSKMNATGTES